MLIESGKVVAVETDGLWVETISRSTCGSCAAQKGCGQSLLARFAGHTTYLWVSLGGRDSTDYDVGDEIELGVPEAVVANGSMLVYLLPLISMLGFTLGAHQLGWGEGLTTLAGLAGLLGGGALVRWRAHVTRHDSRLQPVLVDHQQVVHVS
ncbi:SoxR reducing system RseC family protein [Gilvimarinus agarilyticus]|uniref:SoxR reducing system RseC family protein n=1 Tax=unclassified Gilvimarinus TaxID=2642066 RepID=UPI001C097475|nr:MULTISPECIES: SoxR reducing system RseC family protein [unclassified Gilvimarinus]MBU2884692.1 SoxR reducing system RseC family protein [Gilvimarinus agarilyticus]MDO6569800.1 SoxR reducing system RseC family protein [Gilvimarinus sp. 2_MG-2023]MDO6747386.1 SoxR reducing system RseC family protein [Gilvimarinus sp. 1_MG-2023]